MMKSSTVMPNRFCVSSTAVERSGPICAGLFTLSAAIEWHTKPGEVVYEPFSGSGTQIIAAERLGRRCFAMELSPAFVQVAITRWQEFTGREATRG